MNTLDNQLIDAAKAGNVKLTKFLLMSGAAPNACDLNGVTALMRTCHNPISLLQNSAIEIAELLLEAGANPNINDTLGGTPLAYSIRNRYDTSQVLISLLIEAGADVNQAQEGGYPALLLLGYHPNYSKAEMLVNAGADVNAVVNGIRLLQRLLSLHFLYGSSTIDRIIQLLVANGATLT